MSPSSSRTAVTSCSFVVTACRRAFQSATELWAGAAGMLSSWSRNSHIFCTEAAIAALLVSAASAWESCSGRGLQQSRRPQEQSEGAGHKGQHDVPSDVHRRDASSGVCKPHNVKSGLIMVQ